MICALLALLYNYGDNSEKITYKGKIKMTDEKIKNNSSSAATIRRRKRKRLVRSGIVRGIFAALRAFTMGALFCGAEFPFGTFPLALAIACSAEKYIVCTVTGAFFRLAVSYKHAELYLPVLLCVSAVCTRAFFYISEKENRKVVSDKRDIAEKLSIMDGIPRRVCICLLFGSAWAVVRAISGSTFYDIFAGVFFVLCAMLFTLFFSFTHDIRFKNTNAGTAGIAAILFCTVFSLSGMSVFWLDLGVLTALLITIAAGFSGDGARACVVGLLAGLATGGEYAVIFAFTGLAVGIFSDLSAFIAAGIPLLGASLAMLYVGGSGMFFAFLPEILVAYAMIIAAQRLDVLPRIVFTSEKSELCLSRMIAHKKDEENEKNAKQHAAMLSSLSSMIKNMSQVFRAPDRQSISDMCRDVFAKHCTDCSRAPECKKAKEREEDIVDIIAARIMKNSKNEKNADVLRFGCLKKDDIVREINERTAAMMRESAKQDKTGIFAFDYNTAAKIIADTVAKGETAYAVDKEITPKLFAAFENSGIICENLVVCGDRKKYIIATGRDILRSSVSAQEISKLCSAVCGGPFSLPTYSLDGSDALMTLERTKAFEVEYAGRQSAKKGERVCGDSFGVTESREDMFYGFICDGMGSGEAAGATAGLCKTFLSSMLSYGNKKSTTLEMLNMFISNKNTECFSTVDLLEIDLLCGKACFVKSGAAASYIVRRGDVFKIASGTVPIGILQEVNAQITEFDLCEGDVIVMCSDGAITDTELGEEECEMRLAEFLEYEWRLEVNEMAEKILAEVSFRTKRADDVSICVYRIKKAK